MAPDPKKRRPKGVAKLKKDLDEIFAEWVKLNFIDVHEGELFCVTCHCKLTLKTAENGHYVTRGHGALRYDRLDNNPQCHNCNQALGGNLERYREYLVNVYGEVKVALMENETFDIAKRPASWFATQIAMYRVLVANLKKKWGYL
jgi:hypothetical protein